MTAESMDQPIRKAGEAMMKNPCWKGYEPIGTKIKDGKKVPNCVPVRKG